MILLITSTHTVQVTQNVTSTANFNLMPNTDGESTEHREASCTETVEAGVWMDGGEQGWALVVMVVAFSSRTRILGENFFLINQFPSALFFFKWGSAHAH